MDITTLDASTLARRMHTGTLSPIDVVDAFLERIDAWDGRLHAYAEVYAQEARAAAREADRAIRTGRALSPLQGMPIAVKDLIEIEGKPVTAGSTVWRRRSTRTAPVIQRLLSLGFIILGKTHLVQFASGGGWGTNADMGTPLNPWDLDTPRTPGGSSSGSGVAVMGGLAPWALATDTGGSVRIPAAWCGLTGLKATEGLISTEGVVPLSSTLDTLGPITLNAKDAGLLLAAMTGTLPPPGPAWLDETPASHANQSLASMRLAVLPQSERPHADADAWRAYDTSLAQFAAMGAEIVPFDPPWDLDTLTSASGIIAGFESYAQYREYAENPDLLLDPNSRATVLSGRTISAQQYQKTLAIRHEYQRRYQAAMAGFDALLTPTTPFAAIPLTDIDYGSIASHFTRFVNFLNLCAVALPNGATATGLPVSLQIAGCPGSEGMVLRIARAFQGATDWHLRRPATTRA